MDIKRKPHNNIVSHSCKITDNREVLRKYKNKRLAFEGVLIQTIKPSKRNGFTYGLVFVSIYAENEKLELDHAVIKMDIVEMQKSGLELNKRYKFTAKIKSYYKSGKLLGVPVNQEHFMLADINTNKVKSIKTSKLKQPTKYTQTRISNIQECKSNRKILSENEILEKIKNMKNNGDVECFINKYTESFQQIKMTKYDIINILYKK